MRWLCVSQYIIYDAHDSIKWCLLCLHNSANIDEVLSILCCTIESGDNWNYKVDTICDNDYSICKGWQWCCIADIDLLNEVWNQCIFSDTVIS